MRGNPVRKTVLYGAGGAILCAAALLVWVLAGTTDRAGWRSDGSGNLLWALQGETVDGLGTTTMGVITLTSSGGCALFIPPDVSVKGHDGQLVELGDIGDAGDWASCCNAASELLGVPISGYMVIRWGDAAALCDALAPVVVDVPAAVTYRGTSSGDDPLVIGRGKQELSGHEILAYVAGASEKEPAFERAERALRAILTAAAQAAPPAKQLARAHSNLDVPDLAFVWTGLVRCQMTLAACEVPTSVIVRDGVGRRMALAVEIQKLISTAVHSKTLLTADAISVAVFNGSGARLVATKAAQYLQARGFRISVVGNADTFSYSATTIVRLTDEAKAWMLRDTLPGASKIATAADFGAHYDALRSKIPLGTDLVLVVGAGMEFNR